MRLAILMFSLQMASVGIPGATFLRPEISLISWCWPSAPRCCGVARFGCSIWRWSRMFAATGRRPSSPGPVCSTGAGAILWSAAMFCTASILGMFVCNIYGLRYHLEARLGAPPATLDTDYLGSARIAIGAWLLHVPGSIGFTLLLMFLFFSCLACCCGNPGWPLRPLSCCSPR